MPVLSFKPVLIEDYETIYPYTSAYGEGSCQHSPVSMYSLSEKYGDSYCIQDGFLYVMRSALCEGDHRVYLAPLGKGPTRDAFLRILDDAAHYGKKVRFYTLTEKAAALLDDCFPGRFLIEEDRDLAEYVYKTRIMATFPGIHLKKRRNEVNAFLVEYRDRVTVEPITSANKEEIKKFEHTWVEINKSTHDMFALEREERMIIKQLDHFDELHLSGLVVRIDGEICGFGYGTKLSDGFYDAIAEKGDR
ncbi:MAG: DUF2156 domain-containing protein, partial [Clostridia bacterium]|nr:DUF2156 domain-containing protein [Clostridia bacterium]